MNARTKSYIHVIVMMLLTFGTPLFPPFGDITEVGMKVLGVFLGTLYAWIFVDIFWGSLFGFVTLSFTGTIGLIPALQQAFGNNVFITLFVISLFAESIKQLGITEFLAHWLMAKKSLIGKPWVLIVAMAAVTFLASAAGPGMATMFLMFSIIVTIAEINGYGSHHKVISMVIAFVLFAFMVGNIAVPFLMNFILYNGFFTKALGGTGLPELPHMILTTIYFILSCIIFVVVCKYILKIDVSKFTSTEELCDKFAETKATKVQKVGLVLLGVFFVLLIANSAFPNASILAIPKALGAVGLGILYMSVFIVWHDEDDKPYLNLMNCFKHGIPWAVMILYGVTIPLINIMESPEVGVMSTINNFFTPIFTSMGSTQLMIVATIVMAIITQFAHNLVLVAMFTPLLVPAIIAGGGNPYTMCWLLFLVLNCAFATPAGSAYAGFIYGHPNVPSKDGYQFGTIFMLISLAVVLIMIPFANMIF